MPRSSTSVLPRFASKRQRPSSRRAGTEGEIVGPISSSILPSDWPSSFTDGRSRRRTPAARVVLHRSPEPQAAGSRRAEDLPRLLPVVGAHRVGERPGGVIGRPERPLDERRPRLHRRRRVGRAGPRRDQRHATGDEPAQPARDDAEGMGRRHCCVSVHRCRIWPPPWPPWLPRWPPEGALGPDGRLAPLPPPRIDGGAGCDIARPALRSACGVPLDLLPRFRPVGWPRITGRRRERAANCAVDGADRVMA